MISTPRRQGAGEFPVGAGKEGIGMVVHIDEPGGDNAISGIYDPSGGTAQVSHRNDFVADDADIGHTGCSRCTIVNRTVPDERIVPAIRIGPTG